MSVKVFSLTSKTLLDPKFAALQGFYRREICIITLRIPNIVACSEVLLRKVRDVDASHSGNSRYHL